MVHGVNGLQYATTDPRWAFVHRMAHMIFTDEQLHMCVLLQWVQRMCTRILSAINIGDTSDRSAITNIIWRTAPVGSWNVCEYHSLMRVQQIYNERASRTIEIYKFDD
jgi:hypothetical protein